MASSRVYFSPSAYLDTDFAHNSSMLEIDTIVVAAAYVWGHLQSSQTVIFVSRNAATVEIVNKERSRRLHIMPFMR